MTSTGKIACNDVSMAMAMAMAAAEGGSASSSLAHSGPKIQQVKNATLDLQKFATQYSGAALLQRLLFIAERSPELQPQALVMLEQLREKSWDLAFFKQAWERMRAAGVDVAANPQWAEEVTREAQVKFDKLEGELMQCRSANNKEGIRTTYLAEGDHFYSLGDISAAIKQYLRARDFNATPDHHAEMNLRIARASLEAGNWGSVSGSVAKVEQSGVIGGGDTLVRMRVLSTLINLQNKQYRALARKLLDPVEGGCTMFASTPISDLSSPRDLAIYTSLCALATFDRQELRKQVLDNVQLRELLDDHAPEFRALITDFYSGHYAPCFAALRRVKPDLQLDIHLSTHVGYLLQKIREKAIVQYASPYLCVDMQRMADAFAAPLAEMEQELAGMISSDLLQARIDSANKVMHARHTDSRMAAFQRALAACNEFQSEAALTLLRANLARESFMVKLK